MHLFRGRHNLKFEIEAIWFHHNLKWVNLKLCLHLKRDIFWRKNTEYKSFIHQEHFTVGIFAMQILSLTRKTVNCMLGILTKASLYLSHWLSQYWFPPIFGKGKIRWRSVYLVTEWSKFTFVNNLPIWKIC